MMHKGLNVILKNPQMALFETPAKPVRFSTYELTRARSRDPVVIADVLAVCAAKPGEWLGGWSFYKVAVKHDVSGFIGPILWRLRDAGRIEEKDVYYGDKEPGGKNYTGFVSHYRIVEAA